MSPLQKQSNFNDFLIRVFALFIPLFSFSFPNPQALLPDIGSLTAPLFEKIATFIGKQILSLEPNTIYSLISDSGGFYINAFFLFFISILFSILWGIFFGAKTSHTKILEILHVFIRYYLAVHLLSYGWNKVFKWQFYLPEPNTLYTPLGDLPRDLVYWSSMGTSRLYNIFLGGTEVMAALLLLFRKTSFAGALLSGVLLLNIVFINLSFNISVKLFSSFLFLQSMILMAPRAKQLFHFLFENRKTQSEQKSENEFSIKYPLSLRIIGFFFGGWILFASMWPYLKTGNLNDDNAPRPHLHGAYATSRFILNHDTLAPLTTESQRWKKIFVHRKGYLVVQDMEDRMLDFELAIDSVGKKLHLINYREGTNCTLRFICPNDSILNLEGNFFGDTISVQCKKQNLNRLWLMQDEFSWTIDTQD